MLYATYDYYQNVYCGAMSQDDFRRHVRSASAYLDQITFGRVGALQDEDPLQCKVSDACCAVAEAYRRNEEGRGDVGDQRGPQRHHLPGQQVRQPPAV